MNKRRVCSKCHQSFCVRYYVDHILQCSSPPVVVDQPNNIIDEVTETCQDNNEVNTNNVNLDNLVDETLEDEEVPEDHISEQEFQELVEELNLSIVDNETEGEDITFKNLSTWLMVLLAIWQLTFNITDSALQSLLKILKVFFSVLTEHIPAFSTISTLAPATLYMFHKKLTMDKVSYEKYVVCIKCHTLYILEDCVTVYRGQKETKKCSFVKHPDHPNKRYRKACEQELLLTVNSPSGKRLLFPFKVYCYRKLENSITELLSRKNFEIDCESWRERKIPDNVMEDVYDGEVWKTFKQDQTYFFEDKRRYGLMLNLDWFQPFKHLSSYSVGAVYLVVLNLPRKQRFKRKNVILLGIIPNLAKEPPTNTFIKPLVTELNIAWRTGFNIYSIESRKIENFKLALLCVGCDIPACRKIGGFLSKFNFEMVNSFAVFDLF